jgi:hypothetical protein
MPARQNSGNSLKLKLNIYFGGVAKRAATVAARGTGAPGQPLLFLAASAAGVAIMNVVM